MHDKKPESLVYNQSDDESEDQDKSDSINTKG
jgi:hypothetical protein